MDLDKRTNFVQEELEALFKYIPSTQLSKLRSVSKECDEGAKRVLRKRRDIKLILTTANFDSRTNWDFLQFLNGSPDTAFVAPVINIKNKNKPQQDFEKGRISISFQVIREICKILGNRGIIKELIIDEGYYQPYFTGDYVLALLGHLPTLEKLDVSELRISGATILSGQSYREFQLLSLKHIKFGYVGYDEKETASLLKEILESSPNLESITGGPWDLGELHLIPMLRDTGRLSKIKGVTLTKSAELDILIQCKPKIELELHSLKIDSSNVVDSNKLFTFLQEQAASLKTFKCKNNSLDSKSIFTLPVLPVMEKLSFKPWRGGCFLSLNYGRQTPALKTLTIRTKDNFQSWEDFLFYEISSEMTPCLSLEEMKLFLNGSTSERMFDNWKNLFPNLKKLDIGNVWQFEIEQISKSWPNLEELTMRIGTRVTHPPTNHEQEDLDEIAFGISPDFKIKTDTTEDNWWMKVPAPGINATVANLTGLKKLKIEGFGSAGMFTDFAVFFGLRHMENLKELKITSNGRGMRDVSGVSTEAFYFLVQNLSKLEKLELAEKVWKRGVFN